MQSINLLPCSALEHACITLLFANCFSNHAMQQITSAPSDIYKMAQEWARSLAEQSRGNPLDYAIFTAGVVDDWADLDEVDERKMLHCFRHSTSQYSIQVVAALLDLAWRSHTPGYQQIE